MELEKLQDVQIICPKGKKRKILKVPEKIINQSKQLTTISIPSGLVCEHSFQAFVDKNFQVRGYQMVDFELSKMEIYEGKSDISEEEVEEADDISKFTSSSLFDEIINLLRGFVDDKDILGSAILTVNGKVLYSSLPQNTLFSTMKEFEVRNEKKLVAVRRMFLELENRMTVCSNYMDLDEVNFILVLVYSPKIKLGMGNLLLRQLAKKIESLN
ncbi:MAG: hypothetical protein GF317_05430 [Candidatus Lokiarchaeota archaeon]|nr:hypothetical protein [Candidatus Lokiarchaeota archaeon]